MIRRTSEAEPETEIECDETIPLFSPSRIWENHRHAIEGAFRRVMESGVLILGNEVRAFENEFAAYVGSRHAVGVSSGTDALMLALKAVDIQPGDEVITTANGPVPTAAAIRAVGGVPRFVDIDPATLQVSARAVEEAIGPRTRCILVVHLFGLASPIEALAKTARARNIELIEDCAQAHGTRWNNRHVGTFGKIGCFSFYPTKSLGAFGDAGMCVVENDALAAKLRELAHYGYRDTKRIAVRDGYNARLDELQAACLRVRLPQLPWLIDRRRRIADLYRQSCVDASLQTPTIGQASLPSWSQFVLRSSCRDRLQAYLHREGIRTGTLYPIPIHLMPAFVDLGLTEGSLPHTERACHELLSIPIQPELTDVETDRIAKALANFRSNRQ